MMAVTCPSSWGRAGADASSGRMARRMCSISESVFTGLGRNIYTPSRSASCWNDSVQNADSMMQQGFFGCSCTARSTAMPSSTGSIPSSTRTWGFISRTICSVCWPSSASPTMRKSPLSSIFSRSAMRYSALASASRTVIFSIMISPCIIFGPSVPQQFHETA